MVLESLTVPKALFMRMAVVWQAINITQPSQEMNSRMNDSK